MAKAGDELTNPVTGLRTVFRKTAQDTCSELLRSSGLRNATIDEAMVFAEIW